MNRLQALKRIMAIKPKGVVQALLTSGIELAQPNIITHLTVSITFCYYCVNDENSVIFILFFLLRLNSDPSAALT